MFEPSYLHATEEVGPGDGIWLGTEYLLTRIGTLLDLGY